MSYSSGCCTETYCITCTAYCDDIVFGTATQTGSHTFKIIDDAGQNTFKTETITSGNNIELTNYLTYIDPERSYTVQITQPDTTTFTRTISGTDYDCFEFRLPMKFDADA